MNTPALVWLLFMVAGLAVGAATLIPWFLALRAWDKARKEHYERLRRALKEPEEAERGKAG